MVLWGIAVPAQAMKVQRPLVAEKPRLLFLDLTATLVELEEVKVLTKLIGTQLDGYSTYAVITSADLRQMTALEAEKQKALSLVGVCS